MGLAGLSQLALLCAGKHLSGAGQAGRYWPDPGGLRDESDGGDLARTNRALF